MKTYVIEREIPGAGAFTAEQLKSISQTSCGVLKEMDGIQWIHSYVTGNKIYCIYKAKNEELIRQHAKKGGFPANTISEVANVISPSTAEYPCMYKSGRRVQCFWFLAVENVHVRVYRFCKHLLPG